MSVRTWIVIHRASGFVQLKNYSKFIGKQGANTINKPGKVLKYFHTGLNYGPKRSLMRVHRIVKSFERDLFTLDPAAPDPPAFIGDDDISFVPGTAGYPA